ncbi:MAG: hypothetical protein KJT03_14455 [Verrucomicrobiae bacterium]|nr:hypothetical protein [Verrucomicrobiae bacterium]
MKDCVIHIGIPKTATSFLQLKVFPHFSGLRYLSHVDIRESVAFNHLQLADDSLYDDGIVQDYIGSLKDDRLLLSEERFSGRFLGFGGVINRSIIAKRLKEVLPDARILVFLRGQTSFIYSTYQQYIKGYAHGIKPFSEFIVDLEGYSGSQARKPEYDALSLTFSPHYVFYFELLSLYTSLFKEVKVLLFEDLIREPEKVLHGMEDFIKPTNSLAGKVDWNYRENQGVSRTELHAIRYFNSTKFMGNRILTKLFRELMLTLNYRLKNKGEDERAAAAEMAGLFHENNRKVIERFPEAGIQRYPDAYPTG